MSREKESSKIANALRDLSVGGYVPGTGYDNSWDRLKHIAEYLIASGIRSKDGFEIAEDTYDRGEGITIPTSVIKPIAYQTK